MNINELKEQLKRKMQDVRSYKLWQTACQIGRTFGEKETRTSSDSITESYEFNHGLGDKRFRIHIGSGYYGHVSVNVVVDGELVFYGEERDPFKTAEISSLCMMEVNKEFREHEGTKILVTRYISGDWLKYFEFEIFEFSIKSAKEAEQAQSQEKARLLETERPLTSQENEFAQSFGVDTGIPVR